jgi:type I restriction enzyme S subunit
MTKVKFEDVATRVNTREDRLNTSLLYYVGGEHIESNEMLVQGCGLIKGSTIGPMFYCGFKKGDILLVSRNPHLRKASMVEFDGICSEKTFVLGTKDSKVLLQEFLALVMQSDDFWNYCEEHKSGGVNYFLNWSTLAKYEFYLPSIQEQKEIADKVWSAYRLKESYKKLLVATDEMVKSQFIEMFENVESYCKLEDLVSDTFPGEWGSEPISENAIKVIRTTNFTNEGYLDLTDVVTRDIEPKKVVRKKLKQGDTILERSGGTKDNPVGRVVFFDEIGDYLPNNFTQVLRPKESVNPVYLFYALYNSYNLNKAAMRAMASQTTGIQNLSMSDFMAKFIVLPSRNEQNKFEQIYRQADKSKFGDFKSQFIEMFGGLCQDTPWSDVVTITNGKAYPEEYQEEGAYPICGSGGIMCYGEKKLCNGNTTILGRKGNINNPIFMESGYWIVDTAFSIDVDKAKLHPKFFYYWCCQYDFTKLNKQGVLPSLTRKDLEKVKMAIPQMRDQLKFVSIAEQADKSKSVIQKALVYLNDIQSDELGKIA